MAMDGSSSNWSRSRAPGDPPGLRRELVVKRVEFLQARVDDMWTGDAGGDRLERLVPVAGDADDDRLVARDAAELDQLLGHRHGGAASRLGENPFALREQPDAGDDLLVADRLCPAA